jgi:hypothetical protein
MRAVVLHVVELGPQARGLDARTLTENGLEVADLHAVVESIADELERRPLLKGKECFLDQISGRLTADPDMVEVLRADTRFCQHKPDRLNRESGLVLDPAEALLFNGGNKLAVLNQTG